MDGFQAFKLWVAMTQHFTTKSFDVFKNRGKMRGKFQTFEQRADRVQFERLANKFTPRDYILFLASNLMYGNKSAVWEYGPAAANYNQFLVHRAKIGEIVVQDIKTLEQKNVKLYDGISIIRVLTQNQITFETVSILNTYVNLTNDIRNTPLKTMLEPLLLRIDKSKGFVLIPKTLDNYVQEKINQTKNKLNKQANL